MPSHFSYDHETSQVENDQHCRAFLPLYLVCQDANFKVLKYLYLYINIPEVMIDHKAEPLYQRALQIREQVLETSHPRTREVAQNYVLLLRAMKRDGEADELEARFSPEP
jgi:hypothetical protein